MKIFLFILMIVCLWGSGFVIGISDTGVAFRASFQQVHKS